MRRLKKYRLYLYLLVILITVPIIRSAIEGKYDDDYKEIINNVKGNTWVKSFSMKVNYTLEDNSVFSHYTNRLNSNANWVKTRITQWSISSIREKGIIILLGIFLLSVVPLIIIEGVRLDFQYNLLFSYHDYIVIILKRFMHYFLFLVFIFFLYSLYIIFLKTIGPIQYAIETDTKTHYDIWNDKKQYFYGGVGVLGILFLLLWAFYRNESIEQEHTLKGFIKKLNIFDKFFLVLSIISLPIGIYYAIKMYQSPGYRLSDVSPVYYVYFISISGYTYKFYKLFKGLDEGRRAFFSKSNPVGFNNIWKDKWSRVFIVSLILMLTSLVAVAILALPYIITDLKHNY